MKYFRMSYDEVVFRRSYINLILLNRAIPGMKPFDAEEDEDGDSRKVKVRRKGITKDQHANDFFSQFM